MEIKVTNEITNVIPGSLVTPMMLPIDMFLLPDITSDITPRNLARKLIQLDTFIQALLTSEHLYMPLPIDSMTKGERKTIEESIYINDPRLANQITFIDGDTLPSVSENGIANFDFYFETFMYFLSNDAHRQLMVDVCNGLFEWNEKIGKGIQRVDPEDLTSDDWLISGFATKMAGWATRSFKTAIELRTPFLQVFLKVQFMLLSRFIIWTI